MIEKLLARIGGGFFQQAFVVSDFEAAQRACVEALGCSAFVALPATSLPYWYRGREVECAIALGFARSGNVQIELLQPVSGEGVHVEFLETNGPGAHHLGFMVGSIDDELAASEYELLMSGQFGSLRFGYLDTWDALGAYVELVEDPDGVMHELMPWK
jgi:hypothetical protein